MFRSLVTLLVALPMLMPPGMCICQFAPTGKVSAAPPSWAGQRPVGHTSNSRAECRCNSCREQVAAAGLPTDGEDRPASPNEAPVGPGQHAPGCPAAHGDVPTKMAASTAVTIPFDAHPQCFFSLVAEPAARVGRGREGVSRPAVSPPFFISHCTLLI